MSEWLPLSRKSSSREFRRVMTFLRQSGDVKAITPSQMDALERLYATDDSFDQKARRCSECGFPLPLEGDCLTPDGRDVCGECVTKYIGAYSVGERRAQRIRQIERSRVED